MFKAFISNISKTHTLSRVHTHTHTHSHSHTHTHTLADTCTALANTCTHHEQTERKKIKWVCILTIIHITNLVYKKSYTYQYQGKYLINL